MALLFTTDRELFFDIKRNGRDVIPEDFHESGMPANELANTLVSLITQTEAAGFSSLQITISKRPIPKTEDQKIVENILAHQESTGHGVTQMSEAEFYGQPSPYPGLTIGEILAMDGDLDWKQIKAYAIARDKSHYTYSQIKSLREIYLQRFANTKFYPIYSGVLGLPESPPE